MLKFRWETEFKETEIGEIPKDWEVRNLGDNGYFEILSSGINKFEGLKEYISTSCVEGSEIVKIEELITYDKRPSRANMQPVENSVWLARMINSLKFLKANKDLIENKILSTGFLGIKTKKKEICDYLFYYVQTREFQEYKDAYVTGAVQESLTNENAKELIAILPPLPEQARIATVLSWFDDLIENKRRQNEILEKTAMAIFKNWFIDFEPFKDGEFVYNEELGREIPKGWEVKRLGEVVKFLYGKGLPEKDRIEGIYPVVGSSGIVGFHSEYIAEPPTIIIGRKGNAGSVQLLLENSYPIDTVFYSSKHTSTTVTFYIYHLLRVISLEDMALTDTAVPGLNIHTLNSLIVFLPPPPILQSFHSLVEPLFQKIILNQKQIMTLRKIRDTLLPLLVFGKLRVEEL